MDRSWRGIAKLQSKPSTVSDNCPILHSITSIFMTGWISHAFEKIARQGKNLPGFVLENVGISYIPDLRYIFKLQSLFLDFVCAVYSAPWIVWGAAVRRKTLHFFASIDFNGRGIEQLFLSIQTTYNKIVMTRISNPTRRNIRGWHWAC